MTTIRVLRPEELTDGDWSVWSDLQRADPDLASPYFRPEFTKAVAAVRSDVRIAVIGPESDPIAFFPFQRTRLGTGKPVGGRLSDYHGIIGGRNLDLTSGSLLRACGLRSWAFDHLPASQSVFANDQLEMAESPQLDLSRGFDEYVANRRAAKAGDVKDVPAKMRKIERDHGPLRIELASRDRAAFDTLLRWKSEQYARTGLADVFAFEWTIRLLEGIWAEESDAFAGWMSTLHLGDRLVAIHFAMRSYETMHSWFPAYDLEFSKYSPGSMLLYEVARLGAATGIATLDLGKGPERYKLTFANGSRLLAEGVARRGRLSRQVDSSWRSVRTWLKSGPLAVPVQASAKALRPVRERLSFQ